MLMCNVIVAIQLELEGNVFLGEYMGELNLFYTENVFFVLYIVKRDLEIYNNRKIAFDDNMPTIGTIIAMLWGELDGRRTQIMVIISPFLSCPFLPSLIFLSSFLPSSPASLLSTSLYLSNEWKWKTSLWTESFSRENAFHRLPISS